MVTFYKVTAVSWKIGQVLVDVPFFSMVNLIAERRVAPELMQDQMTGERIAAEAGRLLDGGAARETMKAELARVVGRLTSEGDPIDRAAEEVIRMVGGFKR
jgi:lipid-A-disaccharide synthase